jgi:hypothetical protein
LDNTNLFSNRAKPAENFIAEKFGQAQRNIENSSLILINFGAFAAAAAVKYYS